MVLSVYSRLESENLLVGKENIGTALRLQQLSAPLESFGFLLVT
jgi:hypothetical protein